MNTRLFVCSFFSKGQRFLSFPPILQLQLKRFDFDYQTGAMNKIHDKYKFQTTLDLKEFLPQNPDPSPVASPAADVESPQSNTSSLEDRRDRSKQKQQEGGEEQESKQEKTPEKETEGKCSVYQLHSVLIHRGAVSGTYNP